MGHGTQRGPEGEGRLPRHTEPENPLPVRRVGEPDSVWALSWPGALGRVAWESCAGPEGGACGCEGGSRGGRHRQTEDREEVTGGHLGAGA